MTYSQGHPIRPIAGRLALDFVNTADWSPDGDVVHEKLASPADVIAWLEHLGMQDLDLDQEVPELLAYRAALRRLFLGGGDPAVLNPIGGFDCTGSSSRASIHTGQPLTAILAASALSVLSDRREHSRLKVCPGVNCGWIFVDETKNARRKWCSMESCGNRAKAARHYSRSKDLGRWG
ncbi:MAG: CGNR zinc finger domain-containing protein [Pseudomonadota bacterium]